MKRFACLSAWILVFCSSNSMAQTEVRDSILLDDFVKAIESYGLDGPQAEHSEMTRVWLQAFQDYGVDPGFLERRLAKAYAQNPFDRDLFASYRTVEVEFVAEELSPADQDVFPIALHAVRIDVEEEYDDVFNDDLYMYFVTTHDDLLWGKATAIYKDLDEGDAVFLGPKDRGLFGPKGEFIKPGRNLIVDFGLIESDGDDITQLKKISDAIIDLALVAVTIYNPEAGAAAAQARAETKNLLRLVIELDDDDRLVTDSIYLTPETINGNFGSSHLHEFSRRYSEDTFFSSFAYRLHFRVLR